MNTTTTANSHSLHNGPAVNAAEGLSVAGGLTEVVYDRKADTITIMAHGGGGKRLIGVPVGHWQTQDGTLVWDATAGMWIIDCPAGVPRGEGQLRRW